MKLNLFQNNTVQDSVKISTDIQSSINNTIKTQIDNAISSYTNTEQGIKLTIDGSNICAPGQAITLTNDLDLTQTTSIITNQVVKAVINSTQANTVLNDYKLAISQKNVGIDFNLTLIIIVGIIVCGIIIGAPIIMGSATLNLFAKSIFPIIFICCIIATIICTYLSQWVLSGIFLSLTLIFGMVWGITFGIK